MEILVTLKQAYGNARYYPACEKSKLLLDLMKQTSFTKENLKTVKHLGFTVTIDTPDLNLD